MFDALGRNKKYKKFDTLETQEFVKIFILSFPEKPVKENEKRRYNNTCFKWRINR